MSTNTNVRNLLFSLIYLCSFFFFFFRVCTTKYIFLTAHFKQIVYFCKFNTKYVAIIRHDKNLLPTYEIQNISNTISMPSARPLSHSSQMTDYSFQNCLMALTMPTSFVMNKKSPARTATDITYTAPIAILGITFPKRIGRT